MSEALRILKIKTGTVRRLSKDVLYSQKEYENEEARLATINRNGGDEYEVRAQNKVILDAQQMIPDYKKRLASAVEDLELLVSSDDPAFKDSSELSDAKELLSAAKEQL